MLDSIPAILILVGIAAYVVLGGADFGAGFWDLTAGRHERGLQVREHARHAIKAVWEANHVWLVFVLVVCWTAYPGAFAAITSTLYVPLFIAAVGIILRGVSYALVGTPQQVLRRYGLDRIFGLSSVLTPFALGTVIGGIASGRVPPHGAPGDEWTSWLNATSILVGVLSVATAAYLAAVYLTADAARVRNPMMVAEFRPRALIAGVAAGAAAIAGLIVVHGDAPELWDGLTSGLGVVALVASGVAGVATLAFVVARRYEAGRWTAAVAVAAIVLGWGAAQSPDVLPGLPISAAAASHRTLVSLVVSVAVGFAVLVPSLWLLFLLVLRGRFDTTV